MYFFDLLDWCSTQAIGSDSIDLFGEPLGGAWDGFGGTFRSNRDALLQAVMDWYDFSNTKSFTYQYDSSLNLVWPSNYSVYETYYGGFTNGTVSTFDNGWTDTPIGLSTTYKMAGVSSDALYVSTNGYIMLGSGRGNVVTTPTNSPLPAILCGNPGDNWLEPGLTNTDGSIQNLYFKSDFDAIGGAKHYAKILVEGGIAGSTTTSSSWLANFYRDSQYQWFETRAKSNLRGSAGPYNVTNVAQSSSTTSKVWRGDLNGQNWQFMGTGSVISPKACPQCDTYYNQFITTTQSVSNFWVDAENNFANTTQANFNTFVQNMYHQQCLLKQLIKCVDGDTFPTFDI